MSFSQVLAVLAVTTVVNFPDAALAEPMLFSVPSRDGYVIRGQVDGDRTGSVAIIMVAGTGAVDRDVSFGVSNTPRDRIFADLAERFAAAGLTAVRYDKRGVTYAIGKTAEIDPATIVTATTQTMTDDLSAIYDWARAQDGLASRCVIFFAHSEGMAHVGRMASAGAPAPAMVFGMGALMAAPAANFRWNFVDRIPFSLRALDGDSNGEITDAEIDLAWMRTPAAVELRRENFLHPTGRWTEADINYFAGLKAQMFDQMRSQVLAMDDSAAWPSAETPMGTFQWWKSWFTDDVPVARRLSAWRGTPVSLFYGSLDSQTHPPLQIEAAETELGGDGLAIRILPGLGHSLGESVAYGPVEEATADEIVRSIRDGARQCVSG